MESLPESQNVFVAYSGGVDSACLLHALVSLKNEGLIKNSIIAIHVHHGLSKNADDWMAFCEQHCDQYAIDFIGERVELDKTGSIEEAARKARYAAFEKHISQDDILLMAHHSDDQIETFMMRLMRGSGLTGLTGMDQSRGFSSGILVRPWLQKSQQSILDYQSKFDVKHIHDESNDSNEYDRNWWRNELLPKLQDRYPQSKLSILKTIESLQQESNVLKSLLEPIYKQLVEDGVLSVEILTQQPMDVQYQLLRLWLERQNIFPLLNSQQLQQLYQDVILAQQDAEPIFAFSGYEVRRFQNQLYVMKALPSDEELQALQKPFIGKIYKEEERLELPFVTLINQTGSNKTELELESGEYEIAFYQGGLKAKPAGRPTKTLKKWMQEFNIPPWQRAFWPVLLKGGEVTCVPGLFLCEGFCLPNNSSVEIEF